MCVLVKKHLLSLLTVALAASVLFGADKKAAEIPADLPEQYRNWLEEVALLITDEELAAFLELEKDYQRDAFIEKFWRSRDPYPNTARNELRERWEGRVEEARMRFESLTDERSKTLLLNGPPTALVEPRCRGVLVPMEIWFYERSERVRETFAIIFYQYFGAGPFRIWRPLDGIDVLVQQASVVADPRQPLAAIDSCIDRDAILGALRLIHNRGEFDYELLLSKVLNAQQEDAGGEWLSGLATYSTEVPPGAAQFDAALAIQYPGRHQQRTLVQGVITVPRDKVEVTRLGKSATYDFALTGEILRGAALFENFRYQFQIPADEVAGGDIPLVFERALRPGAYRLLLRLQATGTEAFYRIERDLEVPVMEGEPEPVPASPEMAKLLEEANRAILSGDTTIQIVPPQGELLTGPVRFDTLVTGAGIARVAFILDGTAVLRKTEPPFSVELDMGELPRVHELVVEAYDAGGKVIARDEALLNAGAHRFAVQLLEPRSGSQHASSVRAVAKVTVPEGRRVERLELYFNETRVATLYQQPWEHPIVLPQPGQAGYVRAVAYQPDGNATEDVAFVNAPGVTGRVDIEFVELYVSVADRERRPIPGLTVDDFQIVEDGVQQEPTRFDVVSNLPIHALLMLDTSASMEPNLEMAQRAALAFVEAAIAPRDRAAILTFNDHPQLAVRFTDDHELLAAGLAGLYAERGTALWDSLITSLYYFNGITGQRAMILLTDGKDEGSRFSFDDAREYARRSGVAVYAIGLGFERGDREARRLLTRLTGETGGRFVAVDSPAQLPAIYRSIEDELRSRYYIGYQSTNTGGGDEFRRVEVSVDVADAQASTIRGYYP
ncbi:MAG: VWA domain-containing protein [Thermoanaerobaculia bacterium]